MFFTIVWPALKMKTPSIVSPTLRERKDLNLKAEQGKNILVGEVDVLHHKELGLIDESRCRYATHCGRRQTLRGVGCPRTCNELHCVNANLNQDVLRSLLETERGTLQGSAGTSRLRFARGWKAVSLDRLCKMPYGLADFAMCLPAASEMY